MRRALKSGEGCNHGMGFLCVIGETNVRLVVGEPRIISSKREQIMAPLQRGLLDVRSEKHIAYSKTSRLLDGMLPEIR